MGKFIWKNNTGRIYEWESSFGRTRLRWYDAVNMYLKHIQCEGMDCCSSFGQEIAARSSESGNIPSASVEGSCVL